MTPPAPGRRRWRPALARPLRSARPVGAQLRGFGVGASTASPRAGAAWRWALGGALLGGLVAAAAFAPAAWLARAVESATGERLLLADARGTIWSGSAVAVLTGGPDSRDASALPGRLAWRIGLHGTGFEVRATHACCIRDTAVLRIAPGFGRVTVALPAAPGFIGQWPSALLAGLGTPFNTLQLGGSVRLVSEGISVESVQGRWRIDGSAAVELNDVSSRLAPLDSLGSYRLGVSGDPAHAGVATLLLSTREGALRMSGNGTWGPGGVRFRGEANAGGPDSAALANLLNILGRRSGARSVISIG